MPWPAAATGAILLVAASAMWLVIPLDDAKADAACDAVGAFMCMTGLGTSIVQGLALATAAAGALALVAGAAWRHLAPRWPASSRVVVLWLLAALLLLLSLIGAFSLLRPASGNRVCSGDVCQEWSSWSGLVWSVALAALAAPGVGVVLAARSARS